MMPINEKRRLPILRGWLLVLLLIARPAFGGGSSGQIRSLAVSPDGKLIAVEFAKGKTSFIYNVPVDTGTATRLTNAKVGEESGPAFSPDGKRIAYSYSSGNNEHSAIVIGNVDGSDLRRWPSSNANDFSPVFSPDNKTILFSRSGFYGSYSPIAQPHPHAWNFYTSDLEGTSIRQLTNETFYMASALSVSPDGKSMVVVTEDLDSPQKISVYAIDQPGRLLRSLRPQVPREPGHEPELESPNYLPDGKSILFMAASSGKPWRGYDYDIYRVDLETGAVERLTEGNGYATGLKVSADGKTAAFLKWKSDWRRTPVKSEPYLLDLQSHKVTALEITGLE